MMVSDEEKRWLVVGIAMNKLAAPVLRDFIKRGMDTHYVNNTYCHGVTTPCALNTLNYHLVNADPNLRRLKFQNINNNLYNHGNHKNLYNYDVNSSVDLAKLFLPDYLAKFSGFDESLDISAILRLLGFNNPAPIFQSPNPLISIQLSADDVRENVRNTWGHCNVTDWTEVFFNDCFTKLKTLVRSLGLTLGLEKMALDQLSDWETKGCQLCMGHAVDQSLLSVVQQDVKELVKNYKTTEESLAQQGVELTEMQYTVISVQDQQSATRAQLEEHDEKLAAALEWKEQQVKENEDILLKLVSVEKMLSEEIFVRVEGVEKGLAKTDDKVEQLEEAVRSHKMKENKPASAETFDVKSCRSKLAEHYKRTATVPTSVWTKKSPVDIHQIYTRLSWKKKHQNPSGPSQSKLDHYTELFTANKNGVLPKRILVQGKTGIGKSTFVKKLAVDWAELDDETTQDTKKDALTRIEDGEDGHVSEGEEATFQDNGDPSRSRGKHEDMSETQKEPLKKFELVLVINLKEVSKCRSLREIVRSCSIFPEEETALVDDLLSYITKNQEKVLLVFDGYDEYRCGSNSDIYEIFRGKKLRNCCVLITTRISKADELREFKDVHAKITGFSEEDRVDFMIKVLGSKAEADELEHHLSRKKLTDLTRVPLLLLFFCTLWKKGKLKSFPENKTELYLGIVQYVLDYNQGKDSPARFGKVHDFKEVLTEIGKVALECLLKDDHMFEFDQLSDAIRFDESLIIGLLQVTEYAENLRPAGMVSFIHKSIQEFLAAWHITYGCVLEGTLGEIEQHARTIEGCETLGNVFQFVCGLSDGGALKVLELLKAVGISDPTLDLSKLILDVETDTDVPLCDVTDRHERFRDLVHDCFREVQSKAELLSHFLDCTGGVILVTRDRPLSELVPNVNVLTKLAHDCVFRFILFHEDSHVSVSNYECVEDSVLYKSLDFLNCLQTPLRVTDSSEALTVEDFMRKFSWESSNCFFSGSILSFRDGQFQFYVTKLFFFSGDQFDITKFFFGSDDHARLFTGSTTISVPSDAVSFFSQQSCLKFLKSLFFHDPSGEIVKAVGSVLPSCKHLSKIVINGGDDHICYLLEQVQDPRKCSLTIDADSLARPEVVGAHLTSVGALQLASLLPRFNNVIALLLDLRDCCARALDTLVGSITHKTLERLVLSGMSLAPAAIETLGQSLPEMSSLEVLKLISVDGSILQAEEMEALFGGFNKVMPLHRLTFSGFHVRNCLAPLIKCLRFFPNLRELRLERLNIDEHDQHVLLKSFGFLTKLEVRIREEACLHSFHYYKDTCRYNGILELNVTNLTPEVVATLGKSLPEMSSLRVFEFTGIDGSTLQAEEMEALFGGFNRTMPLCRLTFTGFNVRGCLAPLIKCLPFFPNLRELRLEKLNIDERDQCSLLTNLRFLTEHHMYIREGKCRDSFHYCTTFGRKSVELRVRSLTPALAAMLGGLLPEFRSLKSLKLYGARGSTLEAAEMGALFGGFNKTMPLYELTFSGFSMRGRLAPLFRTLRLLPNLRKLSLENLNMDEHDLHGLLESFQFIPDLQELCLSCNSLGHVVTSIASHLINLKQLQYLFIHNTGHSEEDLNCVRDIVQRALPELEIITDCSLVLRNAYIDLELALQSLLFSLHT